jgi:hypothetical protein
MRFACSVFALGLALFSCGGDEAYSVKYASDYTRAPGKLAFLGIFKDGRMNSDYWDQLGPKLTLPYAGAPCAAGYTNELVVQNAELSTAIDDYARANGITDDLLEKLAPMTDGDLIVVITMSGQPPQVVAGTGSSREVLPPPSSGPRGYNARRGGRGPSSTYEGVRGTDQNAFAVSASLYSIKMRRSVGVIGMSYTGPNIDVAMGAFSDKMRDELAGSRCAKWSWDAKLDPNEIRKISE